jgi:hypothetical protein
MYKIRVTLWQRLSLQNSQHFVFARRSSRHVNKFVGDLLNMIFYITALIDTVSQEFLRKV